MCKQEREAGNMDVRQAENRLIKNSQTEDVLIEIPK